MAVRRTVLSSFALTAGLALAGAVTAGGAYAAPLVPVAPVTCGAVVTGDVTLTADLTCVGNALTVAANTATIDLAGHTVSGNGTGTGITFRASTGPSAPEVHVVRGGTIRGFATGVSSGGYKPTLTVAKVTLRGNTTGLMHRVGKAAVDGSTFDANTTAGVQAGAPLTITTSQFVSNGVGLMAGSFGGTTVTASQFRRNATGISCSNTGVNVSGSTFTGNITGLRYAVCGGAVAQNTLIGGTTGMIATDTMSFGFAVTGNRFYGASGVGLQIRGTGLNAGQRVADNVFAANGASGLFVTGMASVSGGVISGNTFVSNGFAPGTLIAPDGTQLRDGMWTNTATVKGNRAYWNSGYGIKAIVPPAVDGGGNTANGNGIPAQCLGVLCTP